MAWHPQRVAELWRHVDRGSRFDWPLTPAALARLLEIVPSFDAATLRTPPDELNVRLREKLSPVLKAKDKRSLLLADWIIKDWGGINRGLNNEPWMEVLGAFEDNEIDRFIDVNRNKRISSWSKLLAFARSEKYAIFDSLNSVALNCALRHLAAASFEA